MLISITSNNPAFSGQNGTAGAMFAVPEKS